MKSVLRRVAVSAASNHDWNILHNKPHTVAQCEEGGRTTTTVKVSLSNNLLIYLELKATLDILRMIL